MLRIALCDDDTEECKRASAKLEAYLHDYLAVPGQVEVFQTGWNLLSRVEDAGGFDLYLLDILMPTLGGIETGRRLRQMGDEGEIIYLTNTNDFAAESYGVRAFFYLLKPVNEDKLFPVLDGAVEKRKQARGGSIVVNTAGSLRRIPLERILYAERVGRRIRYYCTDGVFDSQTIRNSFREAVAPILVDRRFCLCGSSFVLNFRHVNGVNGRNALLDNGQCVTLPRTEVTEFKAAWGSYWLEEGTAW